MDQNVQLRNLPKVDELLKRGDVAAWMDRAPREVVVEAVRCALDEARERLLSGNDADADADSIVASAFSILETSERRSLRRVINATGILLHTNLGRARLAERAARGAAEMAGNYSTLEFDMNTGERGSRHDHVSDLIARVTGAQAAMVVNNNAAATLLCLAAIGAGREIVVSRGELVEIGGSFRIPEIMELGGTVLREVGTTNQTHLYDYERAIGEQTAALLKVHTSNYRIVGFVREVGIKELAPLARSNNLPLIHDLGSGLLIDLAEHGLSEPTVGRSLADGADLVLFSGDKLLGGPQAGILVGKKKWIEQMKQHPLARVVRVDKMTLAALEETFRLYLDPQEALRSIPVLAMIAASMEDLKRRAESIIAGLGSCEGARFTVEESIGRIGGGCAPMMDVPGISVAVEPLAMNALELEIRLREQELPVIARISEGRVLLDMRTISDEETRGVGEVLLALLR